MNRSVRKSIDLKEPLLIKQKYLETTYGPKMRNLSPLNSQRKKGKHIITREQIDELAEFETYMKSLPNIEFNKMISKRGFAEKTATSPKPSERFSSTTSQATSNFPIIYSGNKK